MRNMIYQYWDGQVPPGAHYSAKLIKQWADRIGAEYLFENNPNYMKGKGRYSAHLGQLKIVFDSRFDQYDNILFLDSDIFPVEGLQENPFEGFTGDIGICRESWQTKNKPIGLRNGDKQWAGRMWAKFGLKVPTDSEGNVIIYNSGFVMYSKAGRANIKQNFVPLELYLNAVQGLHVMATSDQMYIHANLTRVDFREFNESWNSYVHYMPDTKGPNRPVNDTRTESTKLVHVQLRGADHFDDQKLWRITNLPVEEWNLD